LRSCNRCHNSITADSLGFEGEFPDYHLNSEIDFCVDCSMDFKKLVDKFCNVEIKNDED